MSQTGSEKMVKSGNAVYITGLPSTIGDLQLADVFKNWKIRRIRIYRDASGIPKGDATIVFVKAVSEVVVDTMDGFQVSQGGLGSYVIRIQQAEFREQDSLRHHANKQVSNDKKIEQDGASSEKKPKRMRYAPAEAPVVILQNLVAPEKKLNESQTIALEEEVGRECLKYGRVLDAEFIIPDNNLLVSFASIEGARKCATLMHGRMFDERVIRAELYAHGRPSHLDDTQNNLASNYTPSTSSVDISKSYEEPDVDVVQIQTRSTASDPPIQDQGLSGFVRASSENSQVLSKPPQGVEKHSAILSAQFNRPAPFAASSTILTSKRDGANVVVDNHDKKKKKRRAAADFFDDDDDT
uniref:RRM domain-containing protein n=1 Tax=Aureoumbra lagunensis TaxID=44058 RepID=A0A7S3JVM0_9STRA